MTEQPTVFVVDDDASVRKALQRLLGSQGYRVERPSAPPRSTWRTSPARAQAA